MLVRSYLRHGSYMLTGEHLRDILYYLKTYAPKLGQMRMQHIVADQFLPLSVLVAAGLDACVRCYSADTMPEALGVYEPAWTRMAFERYCSSVAPVVDRMV